MGNKHPLDYLAVILACVAAGIASWAAYSSSQQASIAGDTERRQLRAYVSMAGINLEAQRRNDGGEMVWDTEPIWQNSGATPARSLRVFNTASATYAKGPTLSVIEEPTFDLGPHDEAFIVGSSVPTSKIQAFVARGIAVYHDAFGHDRVTLACRAVSLLDPEFLNTVKAGEKVRPELQALRG